MFVGALVHQIIIIDQSDDNNNNQLQSIHKLNNMLNNDKQATNYQKIITIICIPFYFIVFTVVLTVASELIIVDGCTKIKWFQQYT